MLLPVHKIGSVLDGNDEYHSLRKIFEPTSRMFPFIRDAKFRLREFKLCDFHLNFFVARNFFMVDRKYIYSEKNSLLYGEGLTQGHYRLTFDDITHDSRQNDTERVKDFVEFNIDINKEVVCDYPCFLLNGDTIATPNFAHFIFEHLPKLFLFSSTSRYHESLPIVVSDRLPARFDTWIKLLIGDVEIRRLPLRTTLFKEDVYACTATAYRRRDDLLPTAWASGLLGLRSIILGHAQHDKTPGLTSKEPDYLTGKKRILFISRKGSSWRRAINEDNLYAICQRLFHVDKLDLSQYDPAEQAVIFNSYSIILLFGGADGVMTLFSSPQTCVIEICAPRHVGIFNAPIFCVLSGARYYRIEGIPNDNEPQIGPLAIDRDYYVNEDSLTRILEYLREND